MTDKNIKLETEYGPVPPEIKAPCSVVIKKNSKIIWNNSLDKVGGRPNQGEIATVTLYEITDDGNEKISAEDFCLGYTGGDELVIPAKGGSGGSHIYNCTVIFEGQFKYDVEATGHATLDPIIIVQPPPVSLMLPALGALFGALIFMGFGYWIGFRRGSNQNRS